MGNVFRLPRERHPVQVMRQEKDCIDDRKMRSIVKPEFLLQEHQGNPPPPVCGVVCPGHLKKTQAGPC